MECATLSARRTGAVASLVFEHLGVPDEPVAIFGAGPISKEVMTSLILTGQSAGEFRIFDPNRTRALGLVEHLNSEKNISARFADTPATALSGCATVICSTTGAKEYIHQESLPSECRLMFPLSLDDFSEDAVLSADRIVCDDFEQCNREEKVFHHLVQKGKITRSSIYAELGEIVTGRIPGRQSQERYFVNAMGLAIEDVAVAKAVLTVYNQQQSKR
jgi:ornithine cyclodeaminase/alanine dehydrogenase-like protein (mu-crystallin family)